MHAGLTPPDYSNLVMSHMLQVKLREDKLESLRKVCYCVIGPKVRVTDLSVYTRTCFSSREKKKHFRTGD